LGPKFALLARAYRDYNALERTPDNAGPIVVSFGMADPEELTERTTSLIATELPPHLRAIVVAPSAESLRRLKAMRLSSNFEIVGPQPSLARLLASAGLAIGGTGGTSIERIFYRVPTIAVPLVANQERTARFLANHGLAVIVDRTQPNFENEMRRVLRNAFRKPPRFPENGLQIDGLGAERVAAHLLN